MVEYLIDKRPAYSVLKVKLNPGESLTLESGAYLLHKGEVDVSTGAGGILSGIARSILGGESVFMNTFRARSPSEIWAAPGVPGDIVAVDMRGETLYVQGSSYLGHIGDMSVSVGYRGLKGLLAERQLFWLKISGRGTLFINSFGAIEEITLGIGERMTLDNGHFVAMDASLKWNARKLGGIKTFIAGGEGIVFDIEGPGRLWVQSRVLPWFASLLLSYGRGR
ncbi:MAG: TIGR00266 family protein [Thermoprotei archaeon]|nr:TIGR00266 family protein [Thermoprotei archaeon]